MYEAFWVNILDARCDTKGRPTQTTQFITENLFTFMMHPFYEVSDQIVQVALEAVGLLLKQSEDSNSIELLQVKELWAPIRFAPESAVVWLVVEIGGSARR